MSTTHVPRLRSPSSLASTHAAARARAVQVTQAVVDALAGGELTLEAATTLVKKESKVRRRGGAGHGGAGRKTLRITAPLTSRPTQENRRPGPRPLHSP